MASTTYIPRGRAILNTVRTPVINIDNGSGTTLDHTLIRPAYNATLVAARVVYDTETTGTVAAATVQIGVAVSGATIVAATALENTKAVGTTTALTLLLTTVAAGTPLIVRHTGVATTAAGEYHVELDYTYDEQ